MKIVRIGWILEKTEKYQKYLKALYTELTKLDDISIKIDTFVNGDWEADEYVFPSHRIRNLLSKFYFSRNNETFETARWSKNYDIVHFQQSFLFSKLVSFVGVKNRPKIVVTLRGGDTYIKPWISENWKNYYKLDNQYNLVDKYIVQSRNQGEYLEQNWGINSNKISVCGISSIIPVKESARVLLKSEKIKIVSVFRLTWEKNVLQSLHFIKKLKNLNINIEYHILGDGPEIGQLMYLINRFELDEIVFVHGYCDSEVVAIHLSSSHFILQLSISEALSASLLEAQSMGVVPIVFNSDGIPEAVTLGVQCSALMSELGDLDSLVNQFLKVIQNPNIYYSKSKLCLDLVKTKFTIEKEVIRLKSIYNSLI